MNYRRGGGAEARVTASLRASCSFCTARNDVHAVQSGPQGPRKCVGRYSRVYAPIRGFQDQIWLHCLSTGGGGTRLSSVRVGQLSLCSQELPLPLGVPRPLPCLQVIDGRCRVADQPPSASLNSSPPPPAPEAVALVDIRVEHCRCRRTRETAEHTRPALMAPRLNCKARGSEATGAGGKPAASERSRTQRSWVGPRGLTPMATSVSLRCPHMTRALKSPKAADPIGSHGRLSVRHAPYGPLEGPLSQRFVVFFTGCLVFGPRDGGGGVMRAKKRLCTEDTHIPRAAPLRAALWAGAKRQRSTAKRWRFMAKFRSFSARGVPLMPAPAMLHIQSFP